MIIFGLDWDKTFTADPDLWAQFVRVSRERGHTVVVVTSRHDGWMWSDPTRHYGDEVRNGLKEAGLDLPVVFAHDQPKVTAAKNAGYNVNIWIDDDPEAVVKGR